MLVNTNAVHKIEDDSEVLLSFIKIVSFHVLDIEHVIKCQIAIYVDMAKYTPDLWRLSILKLTEFKDRNSDQFSFSYYPLNEDGSMNIDKGQTMWWTYEQVRLTLLAKYPYWDEAKLVNMVPIIVM